MIAPAMVFVRGNAVDGTHPVLTARRGRPAAARRGSRPPFLRVARRTGESLPRLDGVRILAVDDDPDARSIARQMLEPLGASVVVAGDAEEALALMGRQRPHIVLCDLLMPGTDGFELARRLRGTPGGRRLPVVAVTALGHETDYYRTWEAGFDGHLTKPIDYADLAWVVRILTRPRSGGGAWWGIGEASGARRRRLPPGPRPRR